MIAELQQHMRRFGYQMIDVPIIEEADLFLTKAGDQIAERLFTFQRSGRNLALRPEFTASAAYRYVRHGLDEVVRWQFSGPVFEDSGHYQRMSVGAELLGQAGPLADAEIIGMAGQGLPGEDWRLVIGHVGLTRRLLERFAIDGRTRRFLLHRRFLLREGSRDELNAQLDAYLPVDPFDAHAHTADELQTQQMLDVLLDASSRGETMGGRSRHDIAQRLLVKRQQAAQRDQVDAALDFLQDWMHISHKPAAAFEKISTHLQNDPIAEGVLADWRQLMSLLDAYHIPTERIVIQPDLARTWDYYTGIVFEIRDAHGNALAGGGRYDELTRLVGGEREVPAVGFAYYLDNLTPEAGEVTPVLTLTADDPHQGIQWAQALRQHGLAVVLGEGGLLELQEAGVVYQGQTFNTPEALIEVLHER